MHLKKKNISTHINWDITNTLCSYCKSTQIKWLYVKKAASLPFILIFSKCLYIFISDSTVVYGDGEGTDSAFWLRTPCTLLSACRLSSLFPTSRLTGAAMVDGPCSRPLHLTGLIGREKFPLPWMHVQGTKSAREATGCEQLINASTDPQGPRPQFTAGRGRQVSMQS